MAKQAFPISAAGGNPIITGGTGFYIQSVLYDIDFTENPEDDACRRTLEQTAEEKGPEYLHKMLAAVDREAAEQIHANNVKRVIRALEYYLSTGEKISAHNEQERKKQAAYNACYFVLNDKREAIYDRIDKRVDDMLSKGLLEEVRGLKERGCSRQLVSMQGLGYKEIGISGRRVRSGKSRLSDKKRYQTFCQTAVNLVPQGKGCNLVGKAGFCTEEDMLSFMLESCVQRGLVE